MFAIRAYSLDPKKSAKPVEGKALPQSLPQGSIAIEGEPLKGLIQIDSIEAQRDFSDTSGWGSDGERRDARRLSTQLRRYYERHLNPLDAPEPSDLDAIRAIQDAQRIFDTQLKTGFSAALKEVENLGYPGMTDPKITIATKILLIDGLDHKASVQYEVLPTDKDGAEALCLPEDYNGLGYQNLISIVFQLMSFRDVWMCVGKAATKNDTSSTQESYFPPPLHLILIEEPEAHLHAQVQQVFIRKAYELLRAHPDLGTNGKLETQLVVSTHSSHVAHECEFSSLRYFRRRPPEGAGEVPLTIVADLSDVFGTVNETQRFVTRYLRATHCDLFFADGAILVEGPAERILVPHFIEQRFPGLHQSYVTLLEIGGSHAHRLRPLIEKIELNTLVITDLDAASTAGKSERPTRNVGQVTRNTTLRQWIPAMTNLDELLNAAEQQKIKAYDNFFSVRTAYQFPRFVRVRPELEPVELVPNTFEDALMYENLEFFRIIDASGGIKKMHEIVTDSATANDLAIGMSDFLGTAKKAELALALLELPQEPWPIQPPTYIREGLSWLQEQVQRQQEVLASVEPPIAKVEAT